MTRDPLTDPQPGDVVRARDEGGVAAWLVVSRDGDDVTLRGMALDEAWTWTEPVAKWADWSEWQGVTAIPADGEARRLSFDLAAPGAESRSVESVVCLADPLDSARLAAEAAEAEVRALTEALEAARRRSLEAYAAWAVQQARAALGVER